MAVTKPATLTAFFLPHLPFLTSLPHPLELQSPHGPTQTPPAFPVETESWTQPGWVAEPFQMTASLLSHERSSHPGQATCPM